ncbi:hypothetical protein QY96_01289 [Bacillus thermotolerans]|nr:hypothetical protein QY96_01289 [Bacillus thermotolerans]
MIPLLLPIRSPPFAAIHSLSSLLKRMKGNNKKSALSKTSRLLNKMWLI